MEACVVICRMRKPKERRNKVLFVNAVNEVTRERAQSFLTDEHIQHIVELYRKFKDEHGFAKVVANSEIQERGGNLSIPLYVRPGSASSIMSTEDHGVYHTHNMKQAIAKWQASSAALRKSMKSLLEMLEKRCPPVT